MHLQALARKISAQSTVLVKNDGNLLPLDPTKKLKIVLIGHDASSPYVSGTRMHCTERNIRSTLKFCILNVREHTDATLWNRCCSTPCGITGVTRCSSSSSSVSS